MVVSKMNKLARALAVMGLLAPAILATAPLSAFSNTDPAVTQEHGSTVSDGMLLYTLSICSVIHNTACEASISTAGPAPSGGIPSASGTYGLPPGGEGTASGVGESTAPAKTKPGEPAATGPATGSTPGAPSGSNGGDGSAPLSNTGAPKPSETGGNPVPNPGEPAPTGDVPTTDASDNPTTVPAGDNPDTSGVAVPSSSETGSRTGGATDTATGTEANPTATGGDETSPSGSGATNVPAPSATSAAMSLRVLPAGIVSIAVMAASLLL